MDVNVGDILESNHCGSFEIIEYKSTRDVKVRFLKTGYETETIKTNVVKGQIRDPLHPSIFGIGFIGEGKYLTHKEVSYSIWRAMLERCYDESCQLKVPTYEGCSVAKEWHNFQNFAKYYEDNYKEGYQLDKDLLLVGNKIYSPSTCVFVPSYINSFMTSGESARGYYKIGVSIKKGHKNKPFLSQINVAGKGKKHLGYFSTENEAYQVWLSEKLKQALNYREEVDKIDKRIYPNMVSIIKTK